MPTLTDDRTYYFVAQGTTSIALVLDASLCSVSIRRPDGSTTQAKYYTSSTVTGIYAGDCVTIASEQGSTNYTITNLSANFNTDPLTGMVTGLVGPGGGAVTWGFFTPPLIAFGGDSITADSKSGTDFANWGWVSHFRRMLVGRADIRPGNVFAVAGQGVSNLNSVQVPAIIASGAPVCCIMIGTNDVGTVDIISGLSQAYASLLSAGVLVVAGPILPHSSPSVFSAANKKIVDGVNRWIYNTATTTPGVTYADTLKYLTDYSTGDARSGALRDGIHTSPNGAYWVAKGFADVVDAMLPARKWYAGVDIGTYDASTNPIGDILPNGLLRGSSGSVRLGATGVTPNNWFGQRSDGGATVTAAFSKEAIAGLTGAESAVMTLGGTGFNGYCGLETNSLALPTGVGAGDTLLFRGKVSWSGLTGVIGLQAVVRILDGSASSAGQVKDGLYSSGNGDFGAEDGEYWMEVRITLPNGVNTPSVRMEVSPKTSGAVSGIVKFSFFELIKIASA